MVSLIYYNVNIQYKHDKILLYNSIPDNIKLLGDLPKQWVDENMGITLKGLISSWILPEAFTTFSAWQSSYANYLDRLQPVHSTGEYFLEVRTHITFFQKVGGSESTSCPYSSVLTWTGCWKARNSVITMCLTISAN